VDATSSITQAQRQVSARGWAVVESAGFTDGRTTDFDAVRAIARQFGVPSDRDGGTDIWPIRPVSESASETFSRRAGEALLHTDAAYRTDPEPLFALFCVRPAGDGGASRLLTARDAIADLNEQIITELRRPVWVWTPPAVFGGTPAEPSAVLAERGHIRWRYDNLAIGERHRPIADAFHEHLETHRSTVEFTLPTDSVLVCDNQQVLHGRTGFTDIARLLLRVRLVNR
jgi:alpha-ketoglutarate-dependent taurine dioxygenase